MRVYVNKNAVLVQRLMNECEDDPGRCVPLPVETLFDKLLEAVEASPNFLIHKEAVSGQPESTTVMLISFSAYRRLLDSFLIHLMYSEERVFEEAQKRRISIVWHDVDETLFALCTRHAITLYAATQRLTLSFEELYSIAAEACGETNNFAVFVALNEDLTRSLVEKASLGKHAAVLRIPSWASLPEGMEVPVYEALMGTRFEPRSVALFGPPGIGKTVFALSHFRMLGYERYILVTPSVFKSKWYGEAERTLAAIFREAERLDIPVLVDDAEHVYRRDMDVGSSGVVSSVISELLSLLLRTKVPVAMTANRASMIDPALLRHGRIDMAIFILYPDRELRLSYLHAIARKLDVEVDARVEELVAGMDYITPAEIEATVKLYHAFQDPLRVKRYIRINEHERRREEAFLVREYWALPNIKDVVPRKRLDEHSGLPA